MFFCHAELVSASRFKIKDRPRNKFGVTKWDLFQHPYKASINFQNRQKGLLRQLHSADLLHPLLALFLFFEEFSLSRYVSAITLGYNVFPEGPYRIPRYDPPAYGRLYDDLEHVPRYDGLHLLDYVAPPVKRLILRRYDGKG